MKKLAIIAILTLYAATASASLITFEDITAGQPGSVENPAEISDLYDIYIITAEEAFFAIDVVITVQGPADIVYATGKSEAPVFGWSSDVSEDPIYGSDNVEIGLAAPLEGVKFPGTAAKITLKATDEGNVTLTLTEGSSFANTSLDALFRVPDVEGQLTVYQTTPEPLTVALLAVGALWIKR